MAFKLFKIIFLIAVFIFTALFIFIVLNQVLNRKSSDISIETDINKNQNLDSEFFKEVATTTKSVIEILEPRPKQTFSDLPSVKLKTETIKITEVSSKSFEELVNSSVIQLYCGNLNSDETSFSNISRGTGIIIDSSGRLLTNRHVIYDENLKKNKNNCFVLKSPFPNIDSQKPKIYYSSEIISYPLVEKFNNFFSEEKYYNDFALLKIVSKVDKNSKINLLLESDHASPDDYLVLETNGLSDGEAGKFNFLPIDWSYQPKDSDSLITLGYGVDISHMANKITSTIGKIAGNININKNTEPQILLIESNATTGFSGGALINPSSKGLVGLVSWITSGDVAGKYTVAIFRDFLRNLMIQDLNFDLKLIKQN